MTLSPSRFYTSVTRDTMPIFEFEDEASNFDPKVWDEMLKRLDKDTRWMRAYGSQKPLNPVVGIDGASQPDETVLGYWTEDGPVVTKSENIVVANFEDPDSDYGVVDVFRFLDPETGKLWCVAVEDLVATLSYEKDDKFHIDRVKVWRDWSDRERAIDRLKRLLTSRNTHWRQVR